MSCLSNAKGDHLQIVQETSPRHSSQSNGAAERAIQTTDGILRTVKDDIEATVGLRLYAKRPVLAWMLRHTGWLHTRFQRHAADGRISFEKLRLRRCGAPLVAFGERVHCRRPGKQLGKIDNQWATGVWLGRVNSTDENIVATTDGAVLSRSIRRRPAGRQWDRDSLLDLVWLPWYTSSVVL